MSIGGAYTGDSYLPAVAFVVECITGAGNIAPPKHRSASISQCACHSLLTVCSLVALIFTTRPILTVVSRECCVIGEGPSCRNGRCTDCSGRYIFHVVIIRHLSKPPLLATCVRGDRAVG